MQTLTGILKRVAIGVLVGLMPASCSIMDYEGDCSVNYRARFRYDMHLHYSDAFAHEVESVTLYAFDESGKFVQQFTDSGEALQQEGYALPFELPAGTYQFVAWCGVENELQSHDVPTLTPGVSTVEELTCTINREYRYSMLSYPIAPCPTSRAHTTSTYPSPKIPKRYASSCSIFPASR